ncbi:MAG: amino acid ABC transporter substrate-binding protein [Desulfobacterales bacterium]|nr:amino acid ABC transporter substrate-binding protein [Desulfobacterales bacterium]
MNLLKIFLNSLEKTVFFFFLIIFLHISPSYAETITFAIDEWCPYLCDPNVNNGLKGYMTDIASIVFQKAGYNTEFKKIPLERAVMMCHKGKIDAILSVYREDAPGMIFPEKEQGLSSNIFLTRKANPWKYASMQSLNQIKKLGLVKGYEYPVIEKFIKAHPEKITEVKDKNPLETLLKMMLKDRIDALLDDRVVIQYTLKKMKLTELFTEAGTPEDSNPLYIAFSPVNPESKKYAEILMKGIEELRKSGELVKIMNKYGMQDWKK